MALLTLLSAGTAPSPYAWGDVIDVAAGQVWTLSAWIDASDVTAGSPQVCVYSWANGALGSLVSGSTFAQTAGTNSQVGGPVTIPAGVAQVVVVGQRNGCTIPSGKSLRISRVQFEPGTQQTSYAPNYAAPNIYGLAASVQTTIDAHGDRWQDVTFAAIEPDWNADMAERANALANALRANTQTPVAIDQYCVSSDAFPLSGIPTSGLTVNPPAFLALFAAGTAVQVVSGASFTLPPTTTSWAWLNPDLTWTIKQDPSLVSGSILYAYFTTSATAVLGSTPRAPIGVMLIGVGNINVASGFAAPACTSVTVANAATPTSLSADISAALTVTNVPQDGSVYGLAYYFRQNGTSAWVPYGEVAFPGLPLPAASIAMAPFVYGQLQNGMSYDFAVGFVGIAGYGPLATVKTGFVANSIVVTTPYLIGTTSPTPAVSGVTVSNGASANGIAAAVRLQFTLTNQPTDGSLSRISIWFRKNGDPAWTFYTNLGVPGLPNPSASQAYDITLADLSNGQSYDFAVTYENAQGQDSATPGVIYTGWAAAAVELPGSSLAGVSGTTLSASAVSLANYVVQATSFGVDLTFTPTYTAPKANIAYFLACVGYHGASTNAAWMYGIQANGGGKLDNSQIPASGTACTMKLAGIPMGSSMDVWLYAVGYDVSYIYPSSDPIITIPAQTMPSASLPKMPSGATITASGITATVFDGGMHTGFSSAYIPELNIAFTLGDSNSPNSTQWGNNFVVGVRQHSASSPTDPTTYTLRTQPAVAPSALGNGSAQTVGTGPLTPGASYDVVIALCDKQGGPTPYVQILSNYAVPTVSSGAPIGRIIGPGHLYGGTDLSITTPITLKHIPDDSGSSRYSVSSIDTNRRAIIDLSQSHLNKTTQYITEASGLYFAGEHGADITGNHTANDTSKVNGVAASTVQDGANRASNVIDSSFNLLATNFPGQTVLQNSGTYLGWELLTGSGTYGGVTFGVARDVSAFQMGTDWIWCEATMEQPNTTTGKGLLVADYQNSVGVVLNSYGAGGLLEYFTPSGLTTITALSGASTNDGKPHTFRLGFKYVSGSNPSATWRAVAYIDGIKVADSTFVLSGSFDSAGAFVAMYYDIGIATYAKYFIGYVGTDAFEKMHPDVTNTINVGGGIDFSSALHTHKTTQYITEAGGLYFAAEHGADITGNHTANDTSKVNGVAAGTISQGASRANAAINSSNQVNYANTSSEYQGNFDGSGNSKKSTMFNSKLPNMLTWTSNLVLETSSSGVSPNITMNFWYDNGTAGQDATIYNPDGSTINVGHTTSSSGYVPLGGVTSGQSIYALMYYTLGSGMTLQVQKTPFTLAQVTAAYADGGYVAINATTAPLSGVSGGSSGPISGGGGGSRGRFS